MTNLNTCLRSVRCRAAARLLGAVLLSLWLLPGALALDPNRTVSQYVRQRWTIENGFPKGPVYSIAQTPDGYLWVGTEAGLIRFDGSEFKPMDLSVSEQVGTGPVRGLIEDGHGDLWIRLDGPRLIITRRQELSEGNPWKR